MLKNIKQAIKELDFFQHPQLLRYQTEPGYRTLTGGIISVILIVMFAIIFSDEVIGTITNMNANGEKNINYETDPSYFELKTNTQSQHFMFAIGISGLDLSTQKYFDISLQKIIAKEGEISSKIKVSLQQCAASQWEGINNDISQSFNNLQFGTWLCPPTDTVLPLQGKYTSTIFQYSKIIIQKCDAAVSSCASDTQISDFIKSNEGGVTVSFYYINPIINAGDIDYLNYYLEDRNYFTFNAVNGVSANLYFSKYHITTDHSIFPWEDISEDEGAITTSMASTNIYSIASNTYAKIYLRKASQSLEVTRTFTKIDQTLAFMGGLLGFILLILTFMKVYNKFNYEIEFGDRIFKQNSNGSFGSEHFNFIVFLGYGFYNILTIFGVHLKWATMRKFHECRVECLKQLDIHLLFKKIEFFEEVSNIVLEDHHIKGIFMLPKKKINQIQQSRRRFLLQTLLYQQLQRRARQILVEQDQYKKIYQKMFEKDNPPQIHGNQEEKEEEIDQINRLKQQFSKSFRVLQLENQEGEKYSQKIYGKLGMKQMVTAIFNQFKQQRASTFEQPLNSVQKINHQMGQIQESKMDGDLKKVQGQNKGK